MVLKFQKIATRSNELYHSKFRKNCYPQDATLFLTSQLEVACSPLLQTCHASSSTPRLSCTSTHCSHQYPTLCYSHIFYYGSLVSSIRLKLYRTSSLHDVTRFKLLSATFMSRLLQNGSLRNFFAYCSAPGLVSSTTSGALSETTGSSSLRLIS